MYQQWQPQWNEGNNNNSNNNNANVQAQKRNPGLMYVFACQVSYWEVVNIYRIDNGKALCSLLRTGKQECGLVVWICIIYETWKTSLMNSRPSDPQHLSGDPKYRWEILQHCEMRMLWMCVFFQFAFFPLERFLIKPFWLTAFEFKRNLVIKTNNLLCVRQYNYCIKAGIFMLRSRKRC